MCIVCRVSWKVSKFRMGKIGSLIILLSLATLCRFVESTADIAATCPSTTETMTQRMGSRLLDLLVDNLNWLLSRSFFRDDLSPTHQHSLRDDIALVASLRRARARPSAVRTLKSRKPSAPGKSPQGFQKHEFLARLEPEHVEVLTLAFPLFCCLFCASSKCYTRCDGPVARGIIADGRGKRV